VNTLLTVVVATLGAVGAGLAVGAGAGLLLRERLLRRQPRPEDKPG
jgi:hypothetical protein